MSLTLLVLNLLSLLSLSSTAPTSLHIGSRSILRAIDDKNGDPRDYAVDLNATNFDAVLRETPANFAVVEFFAHWSVQEKYNRKRKRTLRRKQKVKDWLYLCCKTHLTSICELFFGDMLVF